MSKRWPRFLLALGLTALCVPQIAGAQPDVTTRDHRNDKPTSAPPADKAETVTPKKGFVWVNGAWEWKSGAWEWVGGHYEREKRGKRWRPHKWEGKGGVWVRVDGGWDVAEDIPNAAPPPPEKDNDAYRDNWRDGHLWVSGYWTWKNYKWKWVKGRWEKLQNGKRFVAGRWEDKGGKWTWVGDAWVDAGGPTTAPPAPRDEPLKTRVGFQWVPGHWDWLNGEYRWRKGHFVKLKPKFDWIAGHWDQQGNKWVWVEGAWKERVVAEFPTTAPPAPKREKIGRRKNMVWVLGYYQWKNGQYEWVPGHWEKIQPKKRWLDGRWEQQGNKWVWVEGNWGEAPPEFKFESKGWTLLGSADVFGRNDRDVLAVGKRQGKFDEVTMVVTDSDLQLNDFIITFANGETFSPKVKHAFKEGARSRAIDLPGNNRFIKSIELQYSNLPGGGRAHVDIYGRNKPNNGGGATGGGTATVTTGTGATGGTTTVTTGGTTTTTTTGTVTTGGGSTTVTTGTGGSVSVTTGGGGGVSVTVTGPTDAPPALRAEKIGVKKGFIWVNGRWDWRAGKWEWIGGHWERARGGKTWADGRWEKKGNVYVWVEGGWR